MKVYKVKEAMTVLTRQAKNLSPKERVVKPKVYYFAAANPNGNDPKVPSIFTKFINADFVKKIAEKCKNISNFVK